MRWRIICLHARIAYIVAARECLALPLFLMSGGVDRGVLHVYVK